MFAALEAPPPLTAIDPAPLIAASGSSIDTIGSIVPGAIRHVDPPTDTSIDLAQQLTPRLLQRPTLVVLDLDVRLGIQIAAELFRRRAAHPVLLIARWPHPDDAAVLPVQPVLEVLLREAATLPRRRTRLDSVAFVLDRERATPLPGRAPDDPRADNRYQIAPSDLPRLSTLRARGITRILSCRSL
jgi:hypothetical protein